MISFFWSWNANHIGILNELTEIFICLCLFSYFFNLNIVENWFILQEIQEQAVKFLSAYYPLQLESIKRLCPGAHPEEGH